MMPGLLLTFVHAGKRRFLARGKLSFCALFW